LSRSWCRRRRASEAVSPIFSAILLFIIAISIASLVIIFIWRNFSGAQSLLSIESERAALAIRSRLSIVYTSYGRGLGFVAVYNPSSVPIKVLAIYVNGKPAKFVEVLCSRSYIIESLPVSVEPNEICILMIYLGPPSLYRVTVATSFGNLELSIAG